MTKKYTKNHEWIETNGDIATVGITNFAAEQMGDVVFVELPDIGTEVNIDDDACVIESVKTASDIYAPLTGEIVEVNEDLENNAQLVNEDPEGKAWIFKIKMSDTSELNSTLDADAYKALT